MFCLPQHLHSYGAEVFGKLAAADWLRGLPRARFVAQLAAFLGDANAPHPFRDGNGRAQRAFVSQLSHDAGHHIDWVYMNPDENIVASAASLHRDLAPLQAMLDELVDRPHPNDP